MTWTQLKEKVFYDNEAAAIPIMSKSRQSSSLSKLKDALNSTALMEEVGTLRVHNHFECN